jgi:hypothetical protein
MGVEAGVSVGCVAGESLGSNCITSWSSSWIFSGVVLDTDLWVAELGSERRFSVGWRGSAAGSGAAGPGATPLPRPRAAPLALLGGIVTRYSLLVTVRTIVNSLGCRACAQARLQE